MDKLILFFLLFISSVVHAQIPTDIPKVETRELPEEMQDPFTAFLIIGGSLLIVLVILYFIRADKYFKRWWLRK